MNHNTGDPPDLGSNSSPSDEYVPTAKGTKRPRDKESPEEESQESNPRNDTEGSQEAKRQRTEEDCQLELEIRRELQTVLEQQKKLLEGKEAAIKCWNIVGKGDEKKRDIYLQEETNDERVEELKDLLDGRTGTMGSLRETWEAIRKIREVVALEGMHIVLPGERSASRNVRSIILAGLLKHDAHWKKAGITRATVGGKEGWLWREISPNLKDITVFVRGEDGETVIIPTREQDRTSTIEQQQQWEKCVADMHARIGQTLDSGNQRVQGPNFKALRDIWAMRAIKDEEHRQILMEIMQEATPAEVIEKRRRKSEDKLEHRIEKTFDAISGGEHRMVTYLEDGHLTLAECTLGGQMKLTDGVRVNTTSGKMEMVAAEELNRQMDSEIQHSGRVWRAIKRALRDRHLVEESLPKASYKTKLWLMAKKIPNLMWLKSITEETLRAGAEGELRQLGEHIRKQGTAGLMLYLDGPEWAITLTQIPDATVLRWKYAATQSLVRLVDTYTPSKALEEFRAVQGRLELEEVRLAVEKWIRSGTATSALGRKPAKLKTWQINEMMTEWIVKETWNRIKKGESRLQLYHFGEDSERDGWGKGMNEGDFILLREMVADNLAHDLAAVVKKRAAVRSANIMRDGDGGEAQKLRDRNQERKEKEEYSTAEEHTEEANDLFVCLLNGHSEQARACTSERCKAKNGPTVLGEGQAKSRMSSIGRMLVCPKCGEEVPDKHTQDEQRSARYELMKLYEKAERMERNRSWKRFERREHYRGYKAPCKNAHVCNGRICKTVRVGLRAVRYARGLQRPGEDDGELGKTVNIVANSPDPESSAPIVWRKWTAPPKPGTTARIEKELQNTKSERDELKARGKLCDELSETAERAVKAERLFEEIAKGMQVRSRKEKFEDMARACMEAHNSTKWKSTENARELAQRKRQAEQQMRKAVTGWKSEVNDPGNEGERHRNKKEDLEKFLMQFEHERATVEHCNGNPLRGDDRFEWTENFPTALAHARLIARSPEAWRILQLQRSAQE